MKRRVNGQLISCVCHRESGCIKWNPYTRSWECELCGQFYLPQVIDVNEEKKLLDLLTPLNSKSNVLQRKK